MDISYGAHIFQGSNSFQVNGQIRCFVGYVTLQNVCKSVNGQSANGVLEKVNSGRASAAQKPIILEWDYIHFLLAILFHVLEMSVYPRKK